MSLIESMSKDFSVDVKEDPASEKEIKELKKYSQIEVPGEYIELMYQATELEIKVKDKKYLRIWSPKGCIEMNEAYNIQFYIPRSLAIGDDEGCNIILYASGSQGYGLYSVSFGDLDINEAIFIAPTLEDLFEKNIGIEKILSL